MTVASWAMQTVLHIQAFKDAEANVWWCTSGDIPGLVSEAPTFDALIERVAAAVPELMVEQAGLGKAF